jgi:hypothetical protein
VILKINEILQAEKNKVSASELIIIADATDVGSDKIYEIVKKY